jgi:hypothetical protein
MSSGGSITNCQSFVSTVFIFKTPQSQNAADTIYEAKKTEVANAISGAANPTNIRHDVNLMFKSDYERIQYLIGLYGRTSQGRR